MRRILVVLACLCLGGPVQAQLANDCGDTQEAGIVRSETLRYFTDGGKYGALREGRWETLPANVANQVVTDLKRCRAIVKKVNTRIGVEFPASHIFRTKPIAHMIFEFGPYVVVVFDALVGDDPDVPSAGWSPMWIFDKATLAFRWEQGI